MVSCHLLFVPESDFFTATSVSQQALQKLAMALPWHQGLCQHLQVGPLTLLTICTCRPS